MNKKKAKIEIQDPRYEAHPEHDWEFWDEYRGPRTYCEPVGDFLARIVDRCQHLENAYIKWEGDPYETIQIEGLREPTEKELAAAEKRRLAKEKKEKEEALKLIAKYPELIQDAAGLAVRQSLNASSPS